MPLQDAISLDVFALDRDVFEEGLDVGVLDATQVDIAVFTEKVGIASSQELDEVVGLVTVSTLCSIASVLVHHLVEREGPLHVAVGRHRKVPLALSACCADIVQNPNNFQFGVFYT